MENKKNKDLAQQLVIAVLKGESSQTAAEIAEASGYSVPGINAMKSVLKEELINEGVEIVESKRGRKAGSTASMGASKPRAQQSLAVDLDAIKAQMEAELRKQIQEELESKRRISAQDILDDIVEIENEIKTLIESKAVKIRQYEDLMERDARKFQEVKAQSVLRKHVGAPSSDEVINDMVPEKPSKKSKEVV
jgi:hypothetical protein